METPREHKMLQIIAASTCLGALTFAGQNYAREAGGRWASFGAVGVTGFLVYEGAKWANRYLSEKKDLREKQPMLR